MAVSPERPARALATAFKQNQSSQCRVSSLEDLSDPLKTAAARAVRPLLSGQLLLAFKSWRKIEVP